MKKLLTLAMVLCAFWVSNVYATDQNTTIVVVDPVCVYGVSAPTLGVYVNDHDVTYSPPKEIVFRIEATDGYDISYTLAVPTCPNPSAPVLTTDNRTATTRTESDGTADGKILVIQHVTNAACNGAPAGTYTYTFTCTANYLPF